MPCRSKNRQIELTAAETPSWSCSRHRNTCKVTEGSSATCRSNQAACCSSGELLPPIGLADVRPLSRHALAQVIAVEAATRNVRPASRAGTPALTASINRIRRSSEYAAGIASPTGDAKRFSAVLPALGISQSDSSQPENALARPVRRGIELDA